MSQIEQYNTLSQDTQQTLDATSELVQKHN